MDRESFVLFPPAGGGSVALKVGADFFPGFKTWFLRIHAAQSRVHPRFRQRALACKGPVNTNPGNLAWHKLSLQKRIAELATETRKGFDRVAKHFEETDKRFRQTDERIDKLVVAIGEFIRPQNRHSMS